MQLFSSIEGILSIIIIIAMGYALTHKGWFNDEHGKLFARVVNCIALPSYMLSNLLSNFDRSKLLALGSDLIIPFASMLFCYFIGYGLSRLIGVKPGRQGIFRCMFFVSNTALIGIPVNVALFGQEKSTVCAIVLYCQYGGILDCWCLWNSF